MRGDASGIFVVLSYFVVAIGAVVGTVGRFWLSGAIAQRFRETFQEGTLLVNISGSFIIGLFAVLTRPDGLICAARPFCVAQWVLGNRVGCTPQKFCGSRWIYQSSSKSWIAKKKSKRSCPRWRK